MEVANDCGIVSKGAAAKRYERLMKANGIHPSGGTIDKSSEPAVPRPRSKAEIAKAAAAKRRKIEADRDDIAADEDDDLTSFIKPELKTESHEESLVKPEPFPLFQFGFAPQYLHPLRSTAPTTNTPPSVSCLSALPPAPQYVAHDHSSMFDNFCTSEMNSRSTSTTPAPEKTTRTVHSPTRMQTPVDVPRDMVLLPVKGGNAYDCILISD